MVVLVGLVVGGLVSLRGLFDPTWGLVLSFLSFFFFFRSSFFVLFFFFRVRSRLGFVECHVEGWSGFLCGVFLSGFIITRAGIARWKDQLDGPVGIFWVGKWSQHMNSVR